MVGSVVTLAAILGEPARGGTNKQNNDDSRRFYDLWGGARLGGVCAMSKG